MDTSHKSEDISGSSIYSSMSELEEEKLNLGMLDSDGTVLPARQAPAEVDEDGIGGDTIDPSFRSRT